MTQVTNPNKMDKETVKKLEEAFLFDCPVSEACFVADISRQTYYNWIKSFPEMKERFDRLRHNPVFLARKSVIEKFTEDGRLALDYLKNKKRNEFTTRTEEKVDSEIKINIINYDDNETDSDTT